MKKQIFALICFGKGNILLVSIFLVCPASRESDKRADLSSLKWELYLGVISVKLIFEGKLAICRP